MTCTGTATVPALPATVIVEVPAPVAIAEAERPLEATVSEMTLTLLELHKGIPVKVAGLPKAVNGCTVKGTS